MVMGGEFGVWELSAKRQRTRLGQKAHGGGESNRGED
jgi:hypothetical protein